jgi:hypothetical protein
VNSNNQVHQSVLFCLNTDRPELCCAGVHTTFIPGVVSLPIVEAGDNGGLCLKESVELTSVVSVSDRTIPSYFDLSQLV